VPPKIIGSIGIIRIMVTSKKILKHVIVAVKPKYAIPNILLLIAQAKTASTVYVRNAVEENI